MIGNEGEKHARKAQGRKKKHWLYGICVEKGKYYREG